MKAFNFRFAALLTLRKQEEEKLFREYSLVLKKYNHLITKKEKITQQLKTLLEKKKDFFRTSQSQTFVLLFQQAKNALTELEKTLDEVRIEMQPWQKKLLAKQKETKVLENLKIKEQQQYKKKKFKKEQQLLEEAHAALHNSRTVF